MSGTLRTTLDIFNEHEDAEIVSLELVNMFLADLQNQTSMRHSVESTSSPPKISDLTNWI